MIERIKVNGKEIILVGTAHISKESIKLVEKTIEEEKPDLIGVELDRERLHQLLSGKKWQEMNLVEIVQTGKTHLFLLNLLLSNIQRQIGAKIGVKPGAEMLAAVKIAHDDKIPLYLVDRDIKITLKRAFDAMSLKEKLKLGYSLIAGFFGKGEKITIEKIEELKREDIMNKLMKDLGKEMPSMKRVLVDERDAYISEMIKNSPGKKIVVVVGAGHLKGIKEIIKEKRKVNMKKLVETPKKKNYLRVIKFGIPLLFVLLVLYAFQIKGVETTLNVLIVWFLANGILSALGALLARAHPLSILTAFIAAPFTSLHPALAAGWFAAIAETRFNSPKVKDFESLSDVSTLSGFYKNKVTHILIVAAFANLGSMLGTIIALPWILTLIA